MIRQLLIAVAIAFFTLGTLLWSPTPATAATQDYSSSKQEQSYSSQPKYGKKYDKKQESSDYSYADKRYADKQADQSRTQEKQSNQIDTDKKQYAQQEQSYTNK